MEKISLEKMFTFLNKYRNVLFSILVVLFIVDSFSTYLAVFILHIAYEQNPFALYLWSHVGLVFGELIRIASWFFIVIFLYQFTKSKKIVFQLIGYDGLFYGIFMWVIVVFGNIAILLSVL